MSFDPKNTEDIDRLKSAASDSYTRIRWFRKQYKAIVDRIAGPHYSENGSKTPSPENNFESFVDIMKGFLIPTNPKAMIRSGERSFEKVRALLELSLNNATEAADFEGTLREAVVDALVLMAITKVGQDFGPEGKTGELFAENVLFERFVFDISATKWKEVSLIGNKYPVLFDDFMESDRWSSEDKKKIKPSTSRYDTDEIDGTSRNSFRAFGEQDYTGFEEYVWFWDYYLPRHELVITVPVNGPSDASVFEDWEGPNSVTNTGPYHILGFSGIPGAIMPLSPLATGMDLHDIANAVLWKVGQQAERAKKLLTFSGPAEEDADRVRMYPDGAAIRVDHPDKVKIQSFDGPDSQVLGFQILASRMFKQKMGSLNLLGGTSADSDTARQDALLTKQATRRVETMAQRVRTYTQGLMRAFAWYLYRDPDKVYNVRKPIAGTGESQDINFIPEDRIIDLGRFDIELDPYSMDIIPPSSRLSRFVQYYQQVIRPDLQLRQKQGSSINFAAFDRIAAKLGNMPELNEIVIASAPVTTQGLGSGRPLQSPQTTRTNINASAGADEEVRTMQSLLGSGAAA